MNVTTRITPPVLEAVFAAQRATALRLRISTAAERIATLKRLEAAVLKHKPEIYRALAADLRKSEVEADLSELMPVISELHHNIRHLAGWMRTKRVMPTMAMLGTKARIRYEPKGVCLIISPWNYPINLTLCPLVSAIAAGNTAIVKPSELSPACSSVLGSIIADVFETDEVALFEGDASVSTALLALPFDHIFFTGSPAIGKVVMGAAAKNLSSVTLELGGKSPVIVDASANVVKAAQSVMWGKLINAGQTCIAPDYVYVHEKIKAEFLAAAGAAVTHMYGVDVAKSENYCRIINERHFARVERLLDGAVADGARIAFGGGRDGVQKFIAPTVLTGVSASSAVMQEEIFGPVLPVMTYSYPGAVIGAINAGQKPLALYVYAKDQGIIERVLSETASGGACVNMSMMHYAHNHLPFGGVNNSGMGAAHGIFGFREFSHQRAVLSDQMSVIPMLFPPYTAKVKRLVALTLRFFV